VGRTKYENAWSLGGEDEKVEVELEQ